MLVEKVKAEDVKFVKEMEIEAGLSAWTERDYLLEIGRSDSLFYIAKEDQKPLGFIVARLIITSNYGSSESIIEIYNLAVKSKYRRKSIGNRLLENIIKLGKRKNVEKISLEVRKSNSGAINFYKKNLFKIDGERKNFYSNPPEDAVLMSRAI